MAWHAEPTLAVLPPSGTRAGLAGAEAARRFAEVGRNLLPPPRRRGPLGRFLRQLHNLLIYVLLAPGAVTALLGHWVDTGVIVGVVVVNAVIGFLQDGKAERALEAIRGMPSLHARVLGDGHRREVAAEELVPGDIVVLASGDKAPADLRLLEVRSLRLDNGPELIATALAEWAEANGIELAFIEPGRPIQNGFIERFNGSYRRSALDLYVFRTLSEVREHTERWLADINEQIPHDALNDLTPVEYRLHHAPETSSNDWH